MNRLLLDFVHALRPIVDQLHAETTTQVAMQEVRLLAVLVLCFV